MRLILSKINYCYVLRWALQVENSFEYRLGLIPLLLLSIELIMIPKYVYVSSIETSLSDTFSI